MSSILLPFPDKDKPAQDKPIRNSILLPSTPEVGILSTPNAPPKPVEHYNMDDSDALRKNIFTKVQEAVQNRFPVENNRYRIEVDNVRYMSADTKKKFSKKEQKEALLKQNSLAHRLKGRWRMIDKESGAVVDEQEKVLANVPYLTERGTFIKNGNEYGVANQSRLKAGAYNRRRANQELETHFNILEGGRSFRIVMDPATKNLTMRVGGAKLQLAPILRSIGFTDRDMMNNWGKDIYNSNIKNDDSDKRAMAQFGRHAKPDESLKDLFEKMKMDPDVTSHTLGNAFSNITPEAIMSATRRLIAIGHGDEDEDDRDSIAFQQIVGPDDLFAERIAKDYDKTVGRRLLWNSTNRGKLMADSGFLTPQIDSVFTKSGLAQALEETNPIDYLDTQYKVLRTGEAGISSDGVPMESRNVQGTHIGIIDPVRGPECYDNATEVFTANGWIQWADVDYNTELACLVEDRMEFLRPHTVYHEHYEGTMYGIKTQYLDQLVTPNHRVWCAYAHGENEQYQWNTAEEVHWNSRKFMCGGHEPYRGCTGADTFELPEVENGSNSQKIYGPANMEAWAALMGWYLSKGSCNIYRPDNSYSIRITQIEELQKSCLEAVLAELPFAYSYNDRYYSLHGKQLVRYMSQFGLSYDRYIPAYLLHADIGVRRALFNALLDGDGRAAGRKQDFRAVSKQLADDFQFLAISLGYSTDIGFEPNECEPPYSGYWRVSVHLQNERVADGNKSKSPGQYYTLDYVGTVHCATVPGGKLYVRRGTGIGTWSGNSGSVGLDSRFSINTRRGSDGQIYTMLRDSKGKTIPVSARTAADSSIAFPGEAESQGDRVRAMVKGKIKYVDRKDVDYWMGDSSHMFSVGSNLVPMLSSTLGPRLLMGGKFYNQALPLKDAEAPLVQSLSDDGKKSFEELYGTKAGAVSSDVTGRVVKVDDDEIHIQTANGIVKQDLYNNFPMNRKTLLSNTPQVQVGDHVKPGDLLASSNATDKKGALALGKNLKVAYMPWKGMNTDDAIVISESAAKKMNSEHLFTKKIDNETHVQRDRKSYVAAYPSMYKKDQLAKIGPDGVIRPGMMVEQGDPLILAVKERPISDIHRGHKPGFMDASEEWDHEAPGLITDVVQSKKGIRISIKAYQPMSVGDKLVGRFGDKGVIASVEPDGEMPTDADGNPMDVILNPMGVVTRTNPSQLVEAMLGKVARKSGKAIKVPGFMKGSMVQFAIDKLKEAGLSDTEKLSDPGSKRTFKDIMVGDRFFMKLHHMSEDKEDARGYGGYTAEDQPVRGGGGGAKQMGGMGLNALLAHGAIENIKDAKTIRAQKNKDYWKAFQMGYAPPSPEVPLIYNKFRAHLTGAGINVDKVGHQENIMALTDKDIDKLSSGAIVLPKGVDIDSMKEIEGGLFDKRLTGGHNGNKWSHIPLDEPMPNPVMEEPIRRILGLTQKKYEDIIAGRENLYERTGGSAILEGLKRTDLKALKIKHEDIIKSGAKSKRDNSVKILNYLRGFERSGMHPRDLVMTKVPVIPPMFRPIAATDKFTIVSDANKLYVDLMKSNQALKDVKDALGSKNAGDERLAVYNSFKSVVGLGDPVSPTLKQQNVKGLLGHVFGGRPKFGMFQRRVLGGSVDFSGRGVISPNSSLDMDQAGLPEGQAWELYKPMVMRRMTMRGMPATIAAKNILERNEIAQKALMEEMKVRPILINRAPTLHKYNTMAVFPQLVKGHTLQISPIIASGFNADFDGDAMQIHVPVSNEAVAEAKEKMLPSKNLLAAGDFKAHYVPSQEFQHGLWAASARASNKDVQTFASVEAALAAYQNGELDADDKVRIISFKKKEK